MTEGIRYQCPRLTCDRQITWIKPPKCPDHDLVCIPTEKVDRIFRKLGEDLIQDIRWWLERGRHGPSGRVNG